MAKSLAELKEENRLAEEKEAAEAKAAEEAVAEAKEETATTLDTPESKAETETPENDSETEEATEEVGELWMQTEEQTPEGDAKFTDSDVANLRRKLKAKIQKEKDENDDLRATVESLQSQIQSLSGGGQAQPQAQAPDNTGMPMPEDFDYDNDAYKVAMAQWVNQTVAQTVQQNSAQVSQQAQVSQAKQQLESDVEAHYQRAANLVKEVGVDADVYKNADLAVRQAFESVLPGNGDAVTDELISRLGEGSEKVMYYLGVNPTKRMEIVNKMASDPSGISASIALGEIKTSITAPKKKVSNAPAPGAELSGSGGSDSAVKARKDYEKATDVQSRISMKRKAKAAGIDTSDW